MKLKDFVTYRCNHCENRYIINKLHTYCMIKYIDNIIGYTLHKHYTSTKLSIDLGLYVFIARQQSNDNVR